MQSTGWGLAFARYARERDLLEAFGSAVPGQAVQSNLALADLAGHHDCTMRACTILCVSAILHDCITWVLWS